MKRALTVEKRLRTLAEQHDTASPAPGLSDFDIPDGVYLAGNSLGLMPRETRVAVNAVLDKWGREGVHGHFSTPTPWAEIDESCVAGLSALVGALPSEIAVLNSLTVNMHLLLCTFYKPKGARNKILIETNAFCSDQHALVSFLMTQHPQLSYEQVREEFIIFGGTTCDQVLASIAASASCVCLVWVCGVQFGTGEVFDMKEVVAVSKKSNIPYVGADLAHAVGNVELDLHSWGVDFAVMCSYKYLNSGPGGVGALFVHSQHHAAMRPPRGWFSVGPKRRFAMEVESPHFAVGASSFQMSNPCVLSMVCLKASLDVFAKHGGIAPMRVRSAKLNEFLLQCLDELECDVEVLTPRSKMGCQISLRVKNASQVEAQLRRLDVTCDARDPDILRMAPTPLYNSFADVHTAVVALASIVGTRK